MFTGAGEMAVPRAFHTATLLNNGKVLIAGGQAYDAQHTSSFPGSAELYDPSTGTFSITGSMTVPRIFHTATLLPDGKVLLAGGRGYDGLSLSSAELYDPSTGTFTATGNMIASYPCQAASLLRDGKVLIAGGFPWPGPNVDAATAELYDPASGTFSATGTGTYASTNPTRGDDFICPAATLLPDGRVLITWDSTLAQLYDPATGTFSPTGSMTTTPWGGGYTQALLANGKVLITGGESDFGRYATAELYDLSSGTFAPSSSMTAPRAAHTATPLPDGKVLIAGGESQSCAANYCAFNGSLASTELYDPSVGTFAGAGDMTTRREWQTATLLNDGRVLISGGLSYGGIGIFFGGLASAELYTPPLLVPAPVLFSLSGQGQGQGAILHASTEQIVSPDNPAIVGEAIEIYLTGLTDGSVIPPQVAIGGRMAEVLWFGKTPGWASLNQVDVRVPSGISSGPAVPVRLTYLGRPSNEVTIAVQ